MKVIQETRRDIYVFIQIVMVNNFSRRGRDHIVVGGDLP
jgi:hypothetical protein